MKLLFSIILLMFSSFGFTQTALIKGTLIDRITREPYVRVNLKLVGTDQKTYSGLDGEFEFDSLAPGRYQLWIENRFADDDYYQEGESYWFNVPNNDTTTIVVEVVLRCVYEMHENDKRCPSCHKKNEVIPISYGLLIGGIPLKHGKETFYDGGCEITGCDPHWYCRRDHTKF